RVALQLALEQRLLEKLLPKPHRDRHREGLQAPGSEREIRFQEPLELEERLVVEHDVVDRVQVYSRLAQAVLDGMARKARVVLLSGKALFLGGSRDLAVSDERGGAVVIERRNAEDAHGTP